MDVFVPFLAGNHVDENQMSIEFLPRIKTNQDFDQVKDFKTKCWVIWIITPQNAWQLASTCQDFIYMYKNTQVQHSTSLTISNGRWLVGSQSVPDTLRAHPLLQLLGLEVLSWSSWYRNGLIYSNCWIYLFELPLWKIQPKLIARILEGLFHTSREPDFQDDTYQGVE